MNRMFGLGALGASLLLFACGGPEEESSVSDAMRRTGPRVSTAGIDWKKELIITDLSVVRDPCRTGQDPSFAGQACYRAWTFERIFSGMAGDKDASLMAESWFTSLMIGSRDRGRMGQMLNAWPTSPSGGFDLAEAPFDLIAIVNRIDLRDGDAGEIRFVFTYRHSSRLTVGLNYRVPAATVGLARNIATLWSYIGDLEFGARYNWILQALTDYVTRPGVAPDRPNGSAFASLQANFFSMASQVRLERYYMTTHGLTDQGNLVPRFDPQNLGGGSRNAELLLDYIDSRATEIYLGSHCLPEQYRALTANVLPASAAGSAEAEAQAAEAEGFGPIRFPNGDIARERLLLRTCTGCHGARTGTYGPHIWRSDPESEASLSGYLTGTGVTLSDGTQRRYAQIARRKWIYARFLAGDDNARMRTANCADTFNEVAASGGAALAGHTCARRADDQVVCWGEDGSGQTEAPSGRFRRIATGDHRSCGLREGGTLECWGSDRFGTPPDGEFRNVSLGALEGCANDGTILADNAVCWSRTGAVSPPELDGGGYPVGILVGLLHKCGRTGLLGWVCWGNNAFGQADVPDLGFGRVSPGGLHTCGVEKALFGGLPRVLRCWGENGFGQASPPAGEFTDVSSGTLHSCAIRDDATLACWGANSYGQSTPPAGRFISISAGAYHNCGVRSDGSIACWGAGHRGQTTPP